MKVSVVIPVYNSEKYIQKCLSSLVEQTLNDIEIICVNDGSKDDSELIIKEMQKKYPNKIKLYTIQNSGAGYARNFGIEKATGEYIGFVDSDDYLKNDMYEKMYQKAKETNADIVICDYFIKDKSKQLIKTNGNKNFFPCTLEKKPELINIIDPSPCNKLFKSDFLTKSKYRFPIGLKYEDFGFIPILLFEAKKIEKVDEPLYYYCLNDFGATATIDNKIFDILKIITILNNFFTIDKVTQKFRKEFEYLIVKKIMIYNEKSLLLKNKKDTIKFINNSYELLNKFFPSWKKSDYFNNEITHRKKIRTFIMRHKNLFILYRLFLKRG